MGCGGSRNTVKRIPQFNYNLVLVNFPSEADIYTCIPRLDLYTIKDFRLASTVLLNDIESLSNFGDVSIATHPSKPVVLLIGETDTTSQIWRVNLSDHSCTISSLCTLPIKGQGYMSCICTHDEDSYVYVMTGDSRCYCTNLDSQGSGWVTLRNLPIDMADVKQVFCQDDTIAFITRDFELICIQSPVDESGDWLELFRQPFPRGLYCASEFYVYSLSKEENALFSMCLQTKAFRRIPLQEADLDIALLKRTNSMAAAGNVLYFSGNHYSEDKVTVIELNLIQKKWDVVGYFDHASPKHRLFVCPEEVIDMS